MNCIIFVIVYTLLSMQSRDRTRQVAFQQRNIGGKNFRVPIHNMQGCEKYLLPKLQNAQVHHTFYSPKDLQNLYDEKGIDLQQLNARVDQQKINSQSKNQKDQSQQVMSQLASLKSNPSAEKGRKRPQMRKNGATHFIQIPLANFIRQAYQNQIAPNILQQDMALLLECQQMHITVMVFRLKDEKDLPKWDKVMAAAKKTKINIKGVGIFGPKDPFANVLYLCVRGLDDLIDRIVSKAVQLGLVAQNELSHIKFDKVSGTYKADAHITILKTRGQDLIDARQYLKTFKDINVGRFTVTNLRLSMVGSFDGSDFYHESQISLV